MKLDLATKRFDKLGTSWTAPDRTRDARWLASGLSIDAIMDMDIEELQNRCAECYRTNTIAHAAVEGRVAQEVGTGIKPQARVRELPGRITADQALRINESLETQVEKWSLAGVDTERKMNLYAIERLIDRQLGIFGESFVLFSQVPSESDINLAIEVIAPERVQTPPGKISDRNVRQGIQYSPSGAILGYYIRTTHPGETGVHFEYRWEFYERYDAQGQCRVLHIKDSSFPQQSRGIPWLAAALDKLKDLDDYWEAELVAKQVEACFGLIFTQGPDGEDPMSVASGNASQIVDRKQLEDLEPGLIHYAANGETVTTVDPQRPGATFGPFVEKTLRSIAATLNFPYEILAKDYFRTTFSSGQLAMLDGRHGFKMRRQVIIDDFLFPLWKRLVNDIVFNTEADGSIDLMDYTVDPDPYLKHSWVAPGWGFINPRDEVRALTEGLEADITTLSDIYAEKGQDVETQLRRRLEEKMMLMKQSVALRAEQKRLEEAAGLPPSETEETSADDDESSQSAEDRQEETAQ